MPSVTFKLATMRDSKLLLSWANASDNLKWKQNTDAVISITEHEKWLKSRIADPETFIWIVHFENIATGQVRLEKRNCFVFTDIYIETDNRGKGIAKKALTHAMNNYSKLFGPQKFRAIVHRNNKASQNFFLKNNFNPVDYNDNDWLLFASSFP